MESKYRRLYKELLEKNRKAGIPSGRQASGGRRADGDIRCIP